MSKGIIVVGNPKECSSCKFSQQLNKIDEPGYCWLADNGEEIWAGKGYKPDWCPIIECEEIVIRMGNNNDKSNS
nr:MAG TPA: hypothetical protein [Caudoviricetes sp.]